MRAWPTGRPAACRFPDIHSAGGRDRRPEVQGNMAASAPKDRSQPDWATGALVLPDGTVFWGRGIGATGAAVGEVCFNTSITGYQEILTDPSSAGQIITFTFPHIGNLEIGRAPCGARGCQYG